MKTYIMMFGIANIISGGPIYGCNKIKFLKEKGWNVILFPTNKGEIYISDLKKYANECYSFICRNPYTFSKKVRKQLLDKLIEKIDLNSKEIIIETGTDYVAYWGEILAKEINAKHVIYLLDEHRERITDKEIEFWKFKHKRKELFCISPQIMKNFFKGYMELREDECYSFKAYCTNSVRDYENDFSRKIKKGDYTIGTVGRLDKIYVNNIIQAVCKFSTEHIDKKIAFCIFGGGTPETIKRIENILSSYHNINYYISGYMWPIPLTALKKCDLFISGAGSAKVTANLNIPTIAMDVVKATPVGFVKDFKKSYLVSNSSNSKTLEKYINQILIYNKKITTKNRIELDEFWKIICQEFDKQVEECLKSNVAHEYFNMEKILNNLTVQNRIFKIFSYLFGYNFSENLRKIYYKILKK